MRATSEDPETGGGILGGLRALGRELRPTIRLAAPVVAAELAWMGMNIVDLIVVGHVGMEAIGAVSIGSTTHFIVVIFAFGMLMGMDTLVSRAFGAGNLRDCRKTGLHGLVLSLALAPLVMGVVWSIVPRLSVFGISPAVLELARPYIDALNWSTLPLLMYVGLRRYLQAMGIVQGPMYLMLAANIVNAIFDIWLVFGGLGVPAYGVAGAGWATFGSRVFMTAGLALVAWLHHRSRRSDFGPMEWSLAWDRFRELLALGLPAAIHLTLEMTIFGLGTLLVGGLGELPLAAHQIVLNMASVTFMVPLGISSAGAVRVGHAIGARDAPGANRAGWTALVLGAGFMACAGLVFVTIPRTLLSCYTNEVEVIGLGVGLLYLAALFQLFDGVQVVSSGVLRGAGDTRTPMLSNLLSYWLVGLPIGAYLTYRGGLGVYGIWVGFTLGLVIVAVINISVWWRTTHRMDRLVAKLGMDVDEVDGIARAKVDRSETPELVLNP